MTIENEERLSGAMQENVLTLLCFDDQRAKLLRSSLKPSLFESAVFRDIAAQAMDFIDQFNEPIKDHLPDTLEHILNGDDSRKALSYKKTIENLFVAKDGINGDYVIGQLNKFVRQQNMKSAIVKAVEAIEDGRIDEAEVEIQKGLNAQLVSFDLGTNIGDAQ